MYKAIFSLISLIPFFFYSLIDGEDVSITQKAPDKMELEQSYQVDLIFNKGESVQGFGKFQTSFPEGIEIDIVEAAGATFTYTYGVMKLIWVNLPAENQFVVSYEIYANEETPSKIQVGGKFSYLLDNQRKSFAILPETILVGEQEELLAEEEAEEQEEFSLNIFRKVQKTGEDRYNVSFVIQKSGIKGFSKIEEYVPRGAAVEAVETMNASFSYVKNKIKYVWLATPEDKEMLVTYSVDLSEASDKDIFNTFGEYSYLNDKNKTKKVLIETRQANMKIPEKKEELAENEEGTEETPTELNIGGVNIKLREATEEELAEMNKSEEGEAVENENVEPTGGVDQTTAQNESSAEEETTEMATTETSSDETESEPVSTDMANSDATNEPEDTAPEEVPNAEQTNDMAESSEPENLKEEDVAAQTSDNQNTSSSSSMNPQSGVFYRVQIAAGKNVVNGRYFEARHQWTNPFVIENHEGWVKYTTENTYPIYKEARNKRNEITGGGHKFDGPFVTAYNDGVRITVQEALMITNQKWFK